MKKLLQKLRWELVELMFGTKINVIEADYIMRDGSQGVQLIYPDSRYVAWPVPRWPEPTQGKPSKTKFSKKRGAGKRKANKFRSANQGLF